MALEVGTNTYVTLAEADAYFATRLDSSTWTDATPEDKEKALIMASRVLNQFRYTGRTLTADQELAFPRINLNVSLNDAQLVKYSAYTTEVPADVKNAQCEQAIYLLDGEDQNRQLMESGVTQFSAGGASFSLYNDGYAALAPKARLFLQPYLTRLGVIRK